MPRKQSKNNKNLTLIQENGAPDPVHFLKERVQNVIGNPISAWAVSATIESLGIREVDVKPDYGYENVFQLGEEIYNRIKTDLKKERGYFESTEDMKKERFKFGSFGKSFKKFLKHYYSGLFFSLPMISQIVAILVVGYALWAWLLFNEAQATVIAFGTIMAFLLTGGFIQTMGRMVSKYTGESNYYLAYESTKYTLRLSLPFLVGVAISIFILNLIIPFFPAIMLTVSLLYMVSIGCLLLTAGILYAVEQRFVITVGILLGTFMVIFAMEVLDLGIYISQFLGIFISIIFLGGYGWLFYKIKIHALRQGLSKQSLPKTEISYYNNYRYFIYGVVYFAFLFMDRFLAWSTGDSPLPYIMWFNTPYELGMDWALFSLVITVAALEFSIHSFSDYLIPAQKKALYVQIHSFNSFFVRFYWKQTFLFLVIAIMSLFLTYFLISGLKIYENEVPEIRDFFANPMTTKVYWFAAVSYIFLIYGLMNNLFFFTMNRPEFVFKTLVFSFVVNFIVGFVASRIFGLEYATIGLLAGSVVFAVASGFAAKKFFRHLDFYYYSAY